MVHIPPKPVRVTRVSRGKTRFKSQGRRILPSKPAGNTFKVNKFRVSTSERKTRPTNLTSLPAQKRSGSKPQEFKTKQRRLNPVGSSSPPDSPRGLPKKFSTKQTITKRRIEKKRQKREFEILQNVSVDAGRGGVFGIGDASPLNARLLTDDFIGFGPRPNFPVGNVTKSKKLEEGTKSVEDFFRFDFGVFA